MTPRALDLVSRLSAERERKDLLRAAIAARASQAEKGDWQKFVRELEA